MPGTSVTDIFAEELDSMVSGGCPDNYDNDNDDYNYEDEDKERDTRQQQDEDDN
jgi:hypothetical protein